MVKHELALGSEVFAGRRSVGPDRLMQLSNHPSKEIPVALITELDLSQEEVAIIAAGLLSIQDVGALHGLRPFYQRAAEEKQLISHAEIEQLMHFPCWLGDYGCHYSMITSVADPDEYATWWQSRTIPENYDGTQLIGTELTISHMIENRLAQATQPFIVLDWDGMAGMSWFRLAARYEREVKKQQIVFVVSNTGYDQNHINQLMERDARQPIETLSEHISRQEMEYIRHYRDLVIHVQATPAQLFTMSLPLGKRALPLLGNVGIIHEAHGMMEHSRIPSLQLPVVLSLLDRYGIFLSSTVSTIGSFRQDHYLSANAELRRTLRIMEQQGMERVMKVEAGSRELIGSPLCYVVLRYPGAPKVHATILPEQVLKFRTTD